MEAAAAAEAVQPSPVLCACFLARLPRTALDLAPANVSLHVRRATLVSWSTASGRR